MLKNIISAVFFTAIIATSMPTIAADNQAIEKVNIAVISDEVAALNDEEALESKSAYQDTETDGLTAGTTAWLFTFALVGFVLLSNRRGV
ncbi:MAG: hypothetical protein WBC07_03470 [Methylotenera sp.]